MIKITDKTKNQIYYANANDNLKEVLTKNNVYIDSPCGGSGTCGKCKVEVDGLPQLSCVYTLKKDITITHNYHETINSNIEFSKGDKKYNIAIDIGTTTLEMAFLEDKKVVKYLREQNKQKSYGADVISRINYENSDMLTEILRTQLENMINKGLKSLNGKIGEIVIVANTTLIHFLLGISPKSLAVAPFTPLITDAIRQENVKILPSLSAFIGADITSSIVYFDLVNQKENILLVDLGTNGEMVFSKAGELYCASTAAGPAFEGANLACGVGGIAGGISKVEFRNEEFVITSIDDESPIGFCGSGAMDLIACLIELEIIDETGRIVDEEELTTLTSLKIYKKYMRNLGGQIVFYFNDKCYLTGRDIREFQLAKSAIRAGMEVLIEGEEQIDKLIITGGLGNHIHIDSAISIKLFNKDLLDKIQIVKNSALLGAIESIDDKFFNKSKEVFKYARYIELSTNSNFTNYFVEYMNF